MEASRSKSMPWEGRSDPLGVVEPFPGNNLFLTIDLELQKTAEEAFQDKNGALIAMDPKTGRILAMVSKPSFDPDLFARNILPEEWKSLVENPHHPLQNKGIQGQYPPGSVFKIITAIAGLESGTLLRIPSFTCTGAFSYGNRDFRCWKEGGHGSLSLHRAIVESCDIYFYQLGLKVGPDLIAHYAKEFGLGKDNGISLPHEKAGDRPFQFLEKETFWSSMVQRRDPILLRRSGISECNAPSAAGPHFRRCQRREDLFASGGGKGRRYLWKQTERVSARGNRKRPTFQRRPSSSSRKL